MSDINNVNYYKPDEKILKALINLFKSGLFEEIREWLNDCAIKMSIENVYLKNDNDKKINDGKIQAIFLFLHHYSNAQKNLEEINKPVINPENIL